MEKHTRVSIVDDDAVVRSALRLMVESQGRYRVVSSHASADDAMSVLPALTPKIVLLDIRMPGMSGIECAGRLKLLLPDVRIVMVTAHVEDALIADAIQAGAIGYLVKPFETEVVTQALDHACAGALHLEGKVSERFSVWMRDRRPGRSTALSGREVEVLSQIKLGYSDKEVARHLGISESTVKSHVRKILAKLKSTSRSGAVSAYFDYF